MAIITISSASYHQRKEIAEKLADQLNCTCIARDVLLETSKEFNIPEVKLISALHDAPSILEKMTYGKERFLAYIKLKILEAVQKDNVIYHGLAGHFFFKGIPHVLKVRFIANPEKQVKEEMERHNITEEAARSIITKNDAARRRWASHLHGTDTFDAHLYDLVVNGDCISVEGAANIITHTASRPCFETTPETMAMLKDLLLCARVESLLIQSYPRGKCRIVDGVAHITVHDSVSKAKKIEDAIRSNEELNRVITGYQVHIEPVN